MNNLLSGDVQVKSMEQTVKYAEQHLGEICSLMASYTRKTAKLRDKADLLVAQLFDFSSREDTEVQIGLKNIAEDLAMVQDYRQAQVQRLETRVVAPLKAYGDIVKNRRAEVNAQKASTNAQRSIRQLEETIKDFQRQKLEDIKRIFTDFITLEMVFHAKALEIYTHTHHSLEAINTQRDLESRSTLQCQRGMEEEEEEEEKEEEEFSESVTEAGRHISRPSYAARHAELRRWQK
uniref:CBY1-interacting BAR domain-containing protein 2-like isoform X2 n=1 Tax=Gasterosteus aculeatus aculeatus TaxID=481459 RepID=UPI001A99C9B4|nr:CBY1-interacting BAR domain-containing protein 2-like isoform X2 [Gasterosteus aculeatus aculeatus]